MSKYISKYVWYQYTKYRFCINILKYIYIHLTRIFLNFSLEEKKRNISLLQDTEKFMLRCMVPVIHNLDCFFICERTSIPIRQSLRGFDTHLWFVKQAACPAKNTVVKGSTHERMHSLSFFPSSTPLDMMSVKEPEMAGIIYWY